jgi:SAM-dependent methyltransferase
MTSAISKRTNGDNKRKRNEGLPSNKRRRPSDSNKSTAVNKAGSNKPTSKAARGSKKKGSTRDGTKPTEPAEAGWSKSKKKRMRHKRAQQGSPHKDSNAQKQVDNDSAKQTLATEQSMPKPTVSNNALNTTTNSPASTAPVNPHAPHSKLLSSFHARLSGSRFRSLNEVLYTTPSTQAYEQFSQQPDLYHQYHEGFRHQVEGWPVNPVNVLAKKILHHVKNTKTTDCIIADMGCGDAELARQLIEATNKATTSPFTRIHSFDLVATNELVTACDMANVPLETASVDIVVFCLSWMGTNLADFVREAHRICKPDGRVYVAEVQSRFPNKRQGKPNDKSADKQSGAMNNAGSQTEFDHLIDVLDQLGWKCVGMDWSNTMFFLLELEKSGRRPDKKLQYTAKPCLYKRR